MVQFDLPLLALVWSAQKGLRPWSGRRTERFGCICTARMGALGFGRAGPREL